MADSIAQAISSGYNLPSSEQTQPASSDSNNEAKLRVGFAAMDPEEQRRIARMGGLERGRMLHEAAQRGESGTARKHTK